MAKAAAERDALRTCTSQTSDCIEFLETLFLKEYSVLCYTCLSKTNRITKLEQQLRQLKEEICILMQGFHHSKVPSQPANLQQPAKKAKLSQSKEVNTTVSF